MTTKHGWHWSFGFLRRPELDMPGMYAYEAPDGDICYSDRPEHHKSAYFDEIGEGMIGLALFPRVAQTPNGRWTVRQ